MLIELPKCKPYRMTVNTQYITSVLVTEKESGDKYLEIHFVGGESQSTSGSATEIDALYNLIDLHISQSSLGGHR